VGAAYGPAKEYGFEGFRDLLALLAKEKFRIVVVGTAKEVEMGNKLQDAFPQTVKNLAGKTNLEELIILLSLSQGYIGNDSGPMHISAVLGKATLGIYGSTDPLWVGPMGPRAGYLYQKQDCAPCYIRRCPLSGDDYMKCMKIHRPKDVFDRFINLINSTFVDE
jgi:heptosyltransferase-2